MAPIAQMEKRENQNRPSLGSDLPDAGPTQSRFQIIGAIGAIGAICGQNRRPIRNL
jgi:hypothetical protein